MILFDKLKQAVIQSTDISQARLSLPVANSPNRKKTVLNDVLDNPYNFKVEAYLDGDEIVMRVKRRKEVMVDVDSKDIRPCN